jgi:hypothetical protein
MSNHLDPTDFDEVIGYYNIGSLNRQQEIWDRAITPEVFAHMVRVVAFKAGRGPDPGPYQGPTIDFEKALLELEERDPYDPESAGRECPPGLMLAGNGKERSVAEYSVLFEKVGLRTIKTTPLMVTS